MSEAYREYNEDGSPMHFTWTRYYNRARDLRSRSGAHWEAACNCGWHSPPLRTETAADKASAEHVATSGCTCVVCLGRVRA